MKNYLKYVLIAVVAITVGCAVGFGAGFWYGQKSGYESGKQAGVETGKQESAQEVSELNRALEVFYPPLPEDIRSVSGEIKSIQGDVIELEISSLTERILPGKEPKKEIRKITVGKDAPIVKVDLTMPPSPIIGPEGAPVGPEEKKISLADLKVGDTVTAEAEENIKTKQEFNAVKVSLLVLP